MYFTQKCLGALAGSLLLSCCAAVPGPPADQLTLVETAPLETDLDSADLPETHAVWLEMIQTAEASVELAHFYACDLGGERLSRIVEALEAAAARGVRVRFLGGERFYETYPELLDRFEAHPDIALRRIDLRSVSDGVQHAKYMLVDDASLYLGSANFDSRSLEHIQELGARITSRAFAAALLDVFEADWALAGGEPAPAPRSRGDLSVQLPLDPAQLPPGSPAELVVRPAFSPRGLLPEPAYWDLPQILSMIATARERVRVQVLTFDMEGRDRTRFEELEDALTAAAARGVEVQLCVADWGKRRGIVEGLQELVQLEHFEVRFVSLPEASTGFIPFARVVHSKYAVVDGRCGWLGTSNWERGYFYASRNVGFTFEGQGLARRLDEYFESVWGSSYAEPVDPAAKYQAPRRQ